METRVITIVGLQRTGASVAMALKASPMGVTVVGYDQNEALLKKAEESGAVDKPEKDLRRAAATADILVLAVAASALEATLRVIGDQLQEHTLVVDLSEIKGPAVKLAGQYLKQGHYIGVRPIFAASSLAAGDSSQTEARADLFKNSVFCVMPSAEVDPQAVETAVRFGHLLGATPYFVDPWEYDSLSQGPETIPGLLAAALFRAVSKAAGWRDILRFADLPFAQAILPLEKSPEELAFLALSDQAATLHWLDALSAELREMRRWVQEGNPEILKAVLDELNAQRTQWLQERRDNSWIEGPSDEVALPGLGEHLFGSLARKKK